MGNRKPLISGNWKMFKTCSEATEAASQLAKLVGGVSDREVMIAPTYTSLALVSAAVKDSIVSVGAQNLFWEDEGAYTGEISADMVTSAGCEYVIIGHSERRQYFNETDENVNKRIKAAIKGNLKPVLCIGETWEEREAEKTFSVLDKQVKKGLEEFSLSDLGSLVIAYEPVWAIGTGKTATTDQAQDVHKFLRSLIKEMYGEELAESMRILYGGSVKPANIAELMSMPDIDGALVGGASLDPETFSQIVKY
ncbi:MAG: triose-phosphate isomerase [Desulfobacterales bacterium]|nr:triose-phosphate isomerase [Desulfobacterales bacterium]